MFQKNAMPNEDIDPRYLTLGGLPVYVQEEPSLLKRAFKKTQDYFNLPEVKLPYIFAMAAIAFDGLNQGQLVENLTMAAILFPIAPAYSKLPLTVLESQLDIGVIRKNTFFKVRQNPYYFDRGPESALNSEKPDDHLSLKTRSTMLSVGALTMAFTPLAVALSDKASEFADISIVSALAISSLFSSSYIGTAYRYGKVALGQWDLTDQLPPSQRKPETAKAQNTVPVALRNQLI